MPFPIWFRWAEKIQTQSKDGFLPRWLDSYLASYRRRFRREGRVINVLSLLDNNSQLGTASSEKFQSCNDATGTLLFAISFLLPNWWTIARQCRGEVLHCVWAWKSQPVFFYSVYPDFRPNSAENWKRNQKQIADRRIFIAHSTAICNLISSNFLQPIAACRLSSAEDENFSSVQERQTPETLQEMPPDSSCCPDRKGAGVNLEIKNFLLVINPIMRYFPMKRRNSLCAEVLRNCCNFVGAISVFFRVRKSLVLRRMQWATVSMASMEKCTLHYSFIILGSAMKYTLARNILSTKR